MNSQALSQHIDERPQQAEVSPSGPLRQYFQRYGHYCVLAYAAVASLSIAASQIAVIALILLWVFSLPYPRAERSPFHTMLTAAIISWLGASLIAAFGGINVVRAFDELYKTSLYVIFPFCVAATLEQKSAGEIQQRISSYLSALIFGLCLAGVHSVASSAVGYELDPGVPGPVTESGQLVLVLPALLALLILGTRGSKLTSTKHEPQSTGQFFLYACVLFVTCLLAAWSALISSSFPSVFQLSIKAGAAVIALALLCFPIARRISLGNNAVTRLWSLWTASGLLFAVFLLNLKRGPWLGFLFELAVIGLLLSRRLLLAGIGAIVLCVTFVQPIQDRLLSLADHFFMEGGRGSMWRIGIELVQRFPLGLGLDNARHMRELEPSLPLLHRHMHNNLLNIAVESGWLGLATYLWWSILVIGVGFVIWKKVRISDNIEQAALATTALCLSVALLGWQVSGLVEYNFGDGEVRLIAFLFMGILLAISNYYHRLPLK